MTLTIDKINDVRQKILNQQLKPQITFEELVKYNQDFIQIIKKEKKEEKKKRKIHDNNQNYFKKFY